MIAIMDGKAVYAKYKITVDGELPPELYHDDYCYTDKELEKVKQKLARVKYTVENLSEPEGWNVTAGVVYVNPADVVEHIEKHIPPVSMKEQMLREKIENTEEWVVAALTRIAEIETVNLVELSDKVRVLEEAKEETIKR